MASYEGKVGQRFPANGTFITSSNMDYIPNPLFGERSISMLRDWHFGEDDPLLHPQPFNMRTPHLALIRHPSSISSVDIMLWFIPANEKGHFDPIDGDGLSSGLGTIHLPFRQVLKGIYSDVVKRYQQEAQRTHSYQTSITSDSLTKDYLARLKFLFSRLELPASYDESVVVFCLTQRVILELDARLTWLIDVRRNYYDPTAKRAHLRNVVGALTDSLEVADNLFWCGVPLWLSRLLAASAGTSVKRWLDHIPTNQLPQWKMDITISYEAASPPHRMIYQGPAGSLERYRAMAIYFRHLSSPAVLYGGVGTIVPAPSLPSSSSRPPITSSSRPSATLSSRLSTASLSRPSTASSSRPSTASSSRPTPYSRPTPTPKVERDKFVEPSSPLMPLSIYGWTEVLRAVGERFDPLVAASTGVSRGYAIPDPGLIACTEKDTTRAFMLTMYVKLRLVILYRLGSTFFEPLRTPAWRKILTLELVTSSTEGTKTTKIRDDAKSNLVRCMVEGGLQGSLDFNNLQLAPTVWHSHSLTPNILPSCLIVQQILWELYEVNFRYELTVIDREYYTLKDIGFDDPHPDDELGQFMDYNELDASDYGDRRLKVLTAIPHFNGSLVPQDLSDGSTGFASSSVEGRREALWGLYRIMRGWTKTAGMSETTHQLATGLESGMLSGDDLDRVEYRLAWFYIQAYVEHFKRAPLTPHRL